MRTSTMHEAVAALKDGDAVIFPTDTVYGLGVSVEAAASLATLFDLKERASSKPIAWLVSSVDDLGRYGRLVPNFAHALARTFWPGPLTLIVKASDEVPEVFRSTEGTIGLRMPDNATALDLIRAVGCPLATTSANPSGIQAPRSRDDLDVNLAKRVAAVLLDESDGNKSGVASSVLDCTHDHPLMLREGAVSTASIRALA